MQCSIDCNLHCSYMYACSISISPQTVIAVAIMVKHMIQHRCTDIDTQLHPGRSVLKNNRVSRTIGLLAGDALDVDNILLAVHLDDLALTTTVAATHDDDLIILADWDGLHLRGMGSARATQKATI